MDNTIEVAVGSVAGRIHRRLGRPNQDAVAWTRTAGGVVLVVCDGCGGAPRSEVGAALGARLWTRALATRLDAGAAADAALFAAAADDVLASLAAVAAAMAAEPAPVVIDHFMFTTLAAAITADTAAVHAIGDGVIALGRDVHVLGPFPDNQPPYLAQGLLGARADGRTWTAPTAAVDRVLLATDGADALLTTLDELGAADVVYRNPHALTRRLSLLAEDAVEIDWDARKVARRPALLADDTTIALARWGRP